MLAAPAAVVLLLCFMLAADGKVKTKGVAATLVGPAHNALGQVANGGRVGAASTGATSAWYMSFNFSSNISNLSAPIPAASSTAVLAAPMPLPVSAAEVGEASAVWAQQASDWDQMTMSTYRGPLDGLTRFTRRSPEVRRILRAARQQGKIMVREATTRYAPELVAQSTVVAATAALAVEA